jgi:hypothetical protein
VSKIETSGYKPWWPMKFHEGRNPDGTFKTSEGFRNAVTNEEFIPPEGWNGEPPARGIGELATVRHAGDAYREGYERIKWDSESASQPSQS